MNLRSENIYKFIVVIYRINRIKEKNMIVLINVEKKFLIKN